MDGGASRNDTLMQLQADLCDRAVIRSEVGNAAALGAALLAGVTVGVFADDEIAQLSRPGRRFEPRMSGERREQLLVGWHAAVAAVRESAQEVATL